MPKIDSHQHFWKYDPTMYTWITQDMDIICADFLPGDLEPILQHYGFSGCVAVQVNQNEEENPLLLKYADQSPYVKGVVGWIDLKAENIEDRLSYFCQFTKLKGYRHILQSETNRAYMLSTEFKRGIAKLKNFGYTYDILIHHHQLNFANKLVIQFPDQPFVIDHLAKPSILAKDISNWEKEMRAISKNENVSCKISGMVTEADCKTWEYDELVPFIDVVFEPFGTDRVMFGSDWPVCRLAATYGQVTTVARNYVAKLSNNEQEKFWGDNAVKFYRLELN